MLEQKQSHDTILIVHYHGTALAIDCLKNNIEFEFFERSEAVRLWVEQEDIVHLREQ